jgi:hypothetical protein
VFERFRHVATTSTLLMADGKIEREGEVVYVVTQKLTPMGMQGAVAIPSMSRDFH